MRNFERSVIVNTLCFAAAAGAMVMACSTEDPGATASDGGAPTDETGTTPVPLPDGAVPDANVEPPKTCAKNADCTSGVCNLATKQCAAANCKDGVKNAVETDIDCGGDCAKCDTLKSCTLAKDCISGVCADTDGKGKKCQVPTNTDGVKNGNETGVDCGNTGNPACADGQACAVRDDCASKYCKAKVCAAVTPDDGVQNGDETDIDCGGPSAKPCADDLMCAVDGDCTSTVCMNAGLGLRCQAPSYTDTKKNGTETDVDCGGNPAYPCATGKSCLSGSDCTTLGCDYNKKCAVGRSCTTHYGGDTCGLGGEGGIGPAQWESCCATATVTPTANNPGGVAPVKTGKYQVTAGRIRVFLEDIGYNVRAYVQNKRDVEGTMPRIPGDAAHYVLDPAWDMYLPVSFAGNTDDGEIAERDQGSAVPQPGIYTSIKNHLGGLIFNRNQQSSTGCFVGSTGGGTHAFRFPDDMQDGPMPGHSQEVYDTKSMQCIDYLVAQAFCVWDGGRLETTQEWLGAWGPGAMPWTLPPAVAKIPAAPADRCAKDTGVCLSTTGSQQGDQTYWGCRFPWVTDENSDACGLTWPATRTVEYAAYRYLYEYPKQNGNDYIVFITPPGRTRGRGPSGHADVIGGNYAITSNITFGLQNSAGTSAATPYDNTPHTVSHGWNGSGSWEVHGYGKGQSRSSSLLNKYGKLGLRCAYPM